MRSSIVSVVASLLAFAGIGVNRLISVTYYEAEDGTAAGDILFFTKIDETYDNVPAISGWVTERRVIFLTGPHLKTQIEYRFDGEFIQSEIDAETGTPVLRGTLTKMDRGRKVAQRVIRLRRERARLLNLSRDVGTRAYGRVLHPVRV